MPKVKVVFDRTNCIGAQSCSIVCPKFWKIAEDGKADLLGSKENPQTGKYELEKEVSNEDAVCLRESAGACPVRVITFSEE
ncbi:MAG: ferredoxin [Candidatus Nealsonbacteria bacterium]|nr:ferredoxin [Candidatus Nealsonbacteria bacterium]